MRAGPILRSGGDRARRIARMTREDAEQLTAVFLQVASLQATDALRALQRRLVARLRRSP